MITPIIAASIVAAGLAVAVRRRPPPPPAVRSGIVDEPPAWRERPRMVYLREDSSQTDIARAVLISTIVNTTRGAS